MELLICYPAVMMKTLGDRIRAARKRAALTQAALGERVGVRPQTVTQWESGDKSPSRENIDRVATYTAVPIEWLLRGGYPLPEQGGNSSLKAPGHGGLFVPVVSALAVIAGDSPLPSLRTIQTYYPRGPNAYVLELHDNSNAPDFPKGSPWVMDPDLPREPGHLVFAAVGDVERPFYGALSFETTKSGTVTVITPLNQAWQKARSDLEPIRILSRLVEAIKTY